MLYQLFNALTLFAYIPLCIRCCTFCILCIFGIGIGDVSAENAKSAIEKRYIMYGGSFIPFFIVAMSQMFEEVCFYPTFECAFTHLVFFGNFHTLACFKCYWQRSIYHALPVREFQEWVCGEFSMGFLG